MRLKIVILACAIGMIIILISRHRKNKTNKLGASCQACSAKAKPYKTNDVPSRTFLTEEPSTYAPNPNNPNLEYTDVNIANHPTMRQSYSYDLYKMLRD